MANAIESTQTGGISLGLSVQREIELASERIPAPTIALNRLKMKPVSTCSPPPLMRRPSPCVTATAWGLRETVGSEARLVCSACDIPLVCSACDIPHAAVASSTRVHSIRVKDAVRNASCRMRVGTRLADAAPVIGAGAMRPQPSGTRSLHLLLRLQRIQPAYARLA